MPGGGEEGFNGGALVVEGEGMFLSTGLAGAAFPQKKTWSTVRRSRPLEGMLVGRISKSKTAIRIGAREA